MPQHMLSIIIPHYNSPTLLEELLDSILVYEQENIEVVVVDDRSDQYLEEYENCINKYSYRVKFYKNETSIKGPGTSRNIGLQQIHGDWVLFADADDYFVDGWYPAVEKYFDSDFDIVYYPPTGFDRVTHSDGVRYEHYKSIIDQYYQNSSEMSLRYEFCSPCSKLFRKCMLETYKIEFDITMWEEDVIFSLETGYYAGKIGVCDKSIYCIIETENSLTTQINKTSFFVKKNSRVCVYKFLQSKLRKDEWKKLPFRKTSGNPRLFNCRDESVQCACRHKTSFNNRIVISGSKNKHIFEILLTYLPLKYILYV